MRKLFVPVLAITAHDWVSESSWHSSLAAEPSGAPSS